MTTVLITQCLYRDSADPIGPHDPLAQPAARQLPRLGPPLGPEPVGGMGMADRLRPSRAGPASHRLGVRQALAPFGRLTADGEAARDHLQHELIHRVEETERPF